MANIDLFLKDFNELINQGFPEPSIAIQDPVTIIIGGEIVVNIPETGYFNHLNTASNVFKEWLDLWYDSYVNERLGTTSFREEV